MKTQFVLALALTACVADDGDTDLDLDAIESAGSYCRQVKHYTHSNGAYRWDVTWQLWGDGDQLVDEKQLGGSFYRQYRVSPVWSSCPHSNESVTLRASTVTLTGTHVCLPDGREEFHGSDYQRVLTRSSPFITYNCDP